MRRRSQIILSANAEYLFDNKKYFEAGLRESGHGTQKASPADYPSRSLTVYALGGQPGKAITAYLKAHAWQELFNLAMTTEPKRTASEIKVLAIEVAGESTSVCNLFFSHLTTKITFQRICGPSDGLSKLDAFCSSTGETLKQLSRR